MRYPQKQLVSQEQTLEIRRDFGQTYLQFAERFNPQIQTKLMAKKADYVYCFNTKYPPISRLALAYSEEGLINWLKIQFDNLNDFVGVKEKMSIAQINEAAALFYYDCNFLNIAEVALFFVKFKLGSFGEFYGAVDPLKIMTAKNQFLSERLTSLNAHDRKKASEELEKQREEWASKAITYEEYLLTKNKE